VTIPLDQTTCLKLLSKDVYESGSIERAFEYQETDIAIINVTHSQFGDLFAMYAYGLDNSNLGLIDAFQEGIKNVNQKKIVIFYSEQFSVEQPYSICAIASDKQAVENYGSRLDKIQKDFNINTAATDGYYRIIDEAYDNNIPAMKPTIIGCAASIHG
jgi:hypothetical protein